VRRLDYNDTWLAAEWGHRSDNLGAILALADYQSCSRLALGEASRTMRDVIIPLLKEKFERYLRGRISQKNSDRILGICADQSSFEAASVDEVMSLMRV